VIASDVKRLSGLVENDVNGLVVEAGDLAAWQRAIARFAADPARRARWGRSAFERAEERFVWPKVASRFEDLLQDLVAGSRAASKWTGDGSSAPELEEGDADLRLAGLDAAALETGVLAGPAEDS